MIPPHGTFCAHLAALAGNVFALLSYKDTPRLLRRCLRRFYRKLKKKLPPEALREIEAAEAEAAIKAARYLRRSERN